MTWQLFGLAVIGVVVGVVLTVVAYLVLRGKKVLP
jgi:hypothetical protein